MSSTITVIPTKNTNVTFGDIVNLSEKYINSSLDSIGLKEKVKLQVRILDYNEIANEETYLKVDVSEVFEWEKNQLLIFSIEGVSGEIKTDMDVIFDSETDPADPWWKLTTYKEATKTVASIEEKFAKAKKVNKSWFLHRSDHNDTEINNCCAVISAAIAELTAGLISSTDKSWGYGQYFVEKEEFLKFYLQPKVAQESTFVISKKEKNHTTTGFWNKLKRLFF